MLDTDDHLDEYIKQLTELDQKGLLPPLDSKLEYKVYSIRGSEFGAHKSIVLTTDDEHFGAWFHQSQREKAHLPGHPSYE